MLPVLFSIGPVSISSFGLFMALALFFAIFTIWRVAKFHDIEEEKIVDLSILTFFGGLIGARLGFILINWPLLNTLEKIALLNRYPGLYLWSGLISGTLVLWLLSKRTKLPFWQVADFGVVGLAIGLFLGDLGCFFGGCMVGVSSNSLLATQVVGSVGKRFPTALFEAIVILLVFIYLRKQVLRFHFTGKIVANFLLYFGLIKLVSNQFMITRSLPYIPLSLDQIFSLTTILLGIYVYYLRSRRKICNDLKDVVSLLYSSKKQKLLLLSLKKSWYNYRVYWQIKLTQSKSAFRVAPKKLKRILNVKSNPTNFTKNS